MSHASDSQIQRTPRLAYASISYIMDPEDSLHISFTHAESELTQLHKATRTLAQSAKAQGRNDAYQELLQWMMQRAHGDLRFVPVTDLVVRLQTLIPSTSRVLSSDDSRIQAENMKRFKQE